MFEPTSVEQCGNVVVPFPVVSLRNFWSEQLSLIKTFETRGRLERDFPDASQRGGMAALCFCVWRKFRLLAEFFKRSPEITKKSCAGTWQRYNVVTSTTDGDEGNQPKRQQYYSKSKKKRLLCPVRLVWCEKTFNADWHGWKLFFAGLGKSNLLKSISWTSIVQYVKSMKHFS